MKCPRCKSLDLRQGTVREGGGTPIEYCSGCKGFWLDAGKLKKICDNAIKELSIPPDAKKQKLCPHCTVPMYSFTYPQTLVTIDMCKKCRGLWFDAKELHEIRLVRKSLADKYQLEEYDEIRGIKGKLISFIDQAIDYLQSI